MLFSKFGINYNELPALHRKGTVIIRVPKKFTKEAVERADKHPKSEDVEIEDAEIVYDADASLPVPSTPGLLELNVDIIREKFWKHYSFLIPPEDNF